MPEIVVIKEEKIIESLKNSTRQYLVGNLKLPQILRNYNNKDLEIGITSYSEPATENPHKHSNAIEYQYMLDGETIYLNVETGEELYFKKGDFFILETGIAYAQKSKENTRILFIKCPGGNDKINIELTPEIKNWLAKPFDKKF